MLWASSVLRAQEIVYSAARAMIEDCRQNHTEKVKKCLGVELENLMVRGRTQDLAEIAITMEYVRMVRERLADRRAKEEKEEALRDEQERETERKERERRIQLAKELEVNSHTCNSAYSTR